MSEDWILLARVARPQGRRGEVLCDLFTDFPRALCGAARAVSAAGWQRGRGHAGDAGRLLVADRELCRARGAEVCRAQQHLPTQRRWPGGDVVLPASQRVTLEEDTFYVSDLQGCAVVNLAGGDGPDELGTVDRRALSDEHRGQAAGRCGSDLWWCSRANGDEVLIPLAMEFVQHPDLTNRRLEMHLPPGAGGSEWLARSRSGRLALRHPDDLSRIF